MNGNVIVNVGVGGWYQKGSQRLMKSLYDNGYTGSVMHFNYIPDGSPSHEDNPYAFKVYAMQKAIEAGFKNIAWIDSSIYCVRDPDSLFRKIIEQGYYFVENGYMVGHETNDHCLSYFSISRDTAMNIRQVSSGFWGINVDMIAFTTLFEIWKNSCEKGVFKGSRDYNKEESSDARFLHHRQDQSALSCCIYVTSACTATEIKIDTFGELFDYKTSGKDCNFLSQGM